MTKSFDQAMKGQKKDYTIKIDGKEYKGIYVKDRVGRDTVPDGWFIYDVFFDPTTPDRFVIKDGFIQKNFHCTILTEQELPIEEYGFIVYKKLFGYAFTW